MADTTARTVADTADTTNYRSPDYLKPEFNKAKAANNWTGMFRIAGALTRHYRGDEGNRAAWARVALDCFRDGAKIPAATAVDEFRRYWSMPEFRTPESLLNAGLGLVERRAFVPMPALSYAAEFLLYALANSTEGVLTSSRVKQAMVALHRLQRNGVEVPGMPRSAIPIDDGCLPVHGTSSNPALPTVNVTVYWRHDRTRGEVRVVLFEQCEDPIVPTTVNDWYKRSWLKSLRRNDIHAFVVINHHFDGSSPPQAKLLIAGDAFSPVNFEYITTLTGYHPITDMTGLAKSFMEAGGIVFPSEDEIKRRYKSTI